MGLTPAPPAGQTPDRTTGVHTGDVSLGLRGETTPDAVWRLSSGLDRPARTSLEMGAASIAEVGGLTLARLGQLLPAVVSVPLGPESGSVAASVDDAVSTVTTEQIQALAANDRVEVTYVSDGPVPLEEAEEARFVCFREANGILEHVAVLIGLREDWPEPVPVRLHSACLTGDLFGSLRCDCGQQLRGSLRVFAARGGGVLLYLAQEGRGIGLGNKLRAYTLQQQGLDTVDADCTLGFGADERRYDAAVEMLGHLQINRIQLLTNNPEKVRALQAGGIDVADRLPLYGTLNRHNLPYVKAKVDRAGHWLTEMLSGPIGGK
jgi:GTP cyclohydrolase II